MEKRWTRASYTRPVRLVAGLLFVASVVAITAFSAVADDSTKGSPGDDSSSRPAFIDRMIEDAWQKAGVKPANPLPMKSSCAGLSRPFGTNSQCPGVPRPFCRRVKRANGTSLSRTCSIIPISPRTFQLSGQSC